MWGVAAVAEQTGAAKMMKHTSLSILVHRRGYSLPEWRDNAIDAMVPRVIAGGKCAAKKAGERTVDETTRMHPSGPAGRLSRRQDCPRRRSGGRGTGPVDRARAQRQTGRCSDP